MCASSEDTKLVENEIANLWAELSFASIFCMNDKIRIHVPEGEQENKDSVAVETEGLESEINKVFETAEGVQ